MNLIKKLIKYSYARNLSMDQYYQLCLIKFNVFTVQLDILREINVANFQISITTVTQIHV